MLRGRGKGDENASAQKPQAAKFLAKPKTANHSTATASVGSFRAEYIPELSSINDPDTQVSIFFVYLTASGGARESLMSKCDSRSIVYCWCVNDVQAEIRRILTELEQLRERAIRTGNVQFATRLAAMSQAARQVASPVTAIDVADAVAQGAAGRLENGPSGAIKETESDLRQRKSSNATKEKNKSPKNSPDSGAFILCLLPSDKPMTSMISSHSLCLISHLIHLIPLVHQNYPNSSVSSYSFVASKRC